VPDHSKWHIQQHLKGLDSRQTLVGDAGIVSLSLTQKMNLLNAALWVKKEITIYCVKSP